MPAQATIYPALKYDDAPGAITWLRDAFGFAEHAVHKDPKGRIAHAEMTLGNALIMFSGDIGPDPSNPCAAVKQSIYVAVPDVAAHHARAKAAGAKLVRDVTKTPYGSEDYVAFDIDGHLWSFGSYDPWLGKRDPGQATIFPALKYASANAAIAWLGDAFSFAEKAAYKNEDGSVMHAELTLGNGMIMFGDQGKPDPANPWATEPQGIYVCIPEIDAHHARATAGGAKIVRPLTETTYGAREYSARDLEGHLWSFGTYDPWKAHG